MIRPRHERVRVVRRRPPHQVGRDRGLDRRRRSRSRRSAPSSPTSRATTRTSFLPAEAESTKVQRLLKDRFPGGETSNGLIVYKRAGGLTAADKRADRRRRARASTRRSRSPRPARSCRSRPGAPPRSSRRGGDAAYTVVTVPLDFKKLADWGKDAREVVGDGGGGLEVYVTGDLGLHADFEEVFGDARHEAAARHRPARPAPARGDLPRAADRADPDRRRRLRLPGRQRLHLPLRRRRQRRQLELDEHPRRADVRRGDRLLPAAREPLPRGAAPRRGQARGDGARAAPRRARRCWPAAAR